MNKKDFNNKCFSPDWLEVDLNDIREKESSASQYAEKGANNFAMAGQSNDNLNKEVRLESQRRKDLKTLLKELDEIKKNIETAAEKQHRLANLMGFYTGRIAQ